MVEASVLDQREALSFVLGSLNLYRAGVPRLPEMERRLQRNDVIRIKGPHDLVEPKRGVPRHLVVGNKDESAAAPVLT